MSKTEASQQDKPMPKTEASQQDKPGMARRVRTKPSTLDTAHKLSHSVERVNALVTQISIIALNINA